MPELNYVPDPRQIPPYTVPSRAFGPPKRTGGTFSGPLRVSSSQSPRFTVDDGVNTALQVYTTAGQIIQTTGFTWLTIQDALTTSQPVATELYHAVSGTPGTNVGVALDLRADGTNATRQFAARLIGLLSTATTPVTSQLRMLINIAGVTTEVLRLDSVGANLPNGHVYQVSSTQVVGPRNAGWTTFSGTANKNAGGLDTGTATTAQVAQVLKSVVDALILHGLLGP